MGDANTPRIIKLAGLLGDWEVDAQAAYDARVNGTARGPVTGFRYLDEELGHALQPGVHFLSGGPGMGKTALAMQIASSCGCPCLYVSAEMGLLELFRRHTARVTKTFLHRLKSGELTPAESLTLARQGAAAAPFLALADATRYPASVDWILDKAAAVKGEAPFMLIVIDSLHSWAEAASPDGANEYDALNTAIRGLRRLAGDLKAPVLAISEQNRASMAKGGINAGAGSRKIEYGSETVIDLAKDDDAGAALSGVTPIKLTLAKNRHGTVGRTFRLKFDGALQTFTEG